jgi:hypothetical protein
MNTKFERGILFNPTPQHTSLYSWCLNETDEDGKRIARDLIPWEWGVVFTAISLSVIRTTSIIVKAFDSSGFSSESSGDTKIHGVLRSGCPVNGAGTFEDTVEFSFLGTARAIASFDFWICCASDGQQDICGLRGIPGYEYEGADFLNYATADHLSFNITLKKHLFDELIRAIEARGADAVTMRVRGVQGFYSDWSPSVLTDSIKVLANKAVPVAGLGEGGIVLPTLSVAAEFELTIASTPSQR